MPLFDHFLRNGPKNGLKVSKNWHKGCFLEFKNYHILRYDIYEFLKKVWVGHERPVWLEPSVLAIEHKYD